MHCSYLQALLAEHPSVKNFIVTEGRDRVGGNITSVSNAEGYQWEEGPNSFQPSDAMLKAAVDAGVADELVFGDPKAPRFVWWEGKLRPTPSGPDVVTFDLVSPLGKIRAGLGAAGFKAGMPGKSKDLYCALVVMFVHLWLICYTSSILPFLVH